MGPVRLIHTSDWHLGRAFHQVGLLDAQAAYLDHLVDVVRTERVDAVLVSGDVCDRETTPRAKTLNDARRPSLPTTIHLDAL